MDSTQVIYKTKHTKQYYNPFHWTHMYQDVVDRNLNIYNKHGTEIWNQVMRDLPSPYPELAEKLYIAKDWSDFFNISFYHLLEEGSDNFWLGKQPRKL